MDLWDLETIDLVGPAFIEFRPNGHGVFSFIAVEGQLDGRQVELDGRPAVEFTWEGTDEGDLVSGRGWAVRGPDGGLRGRLYFHLGDDSGFRAIVAGASK